MNSEWKLRRILYRRVVVGELTFVDALPAKACVFLTTPASGARMDSLDPEPAIEKVMIETVSYPLVAQRSAQLLEPLASLKPFPEAHI